MKAYSKIFVGASLIGSLMLLPHQGSAQHYADLTPDDKNAIATPPKAKKSILSFGFFSPLNSHISLGYDQLIGPDFIMSSQLGIIGPGVNQTNYPAKGAFLEVGPKLFFSPDWVMDGMHRVNAMQGAYFKPQFIASVFSQSFTTYNYYYSGSGSGTVSSTTSHTYTGLALMLNFGKQWVLANTIALDMYVGIGYNLTSVNGTGAINTYGNASPEPAGGNYYSYETVGNASPLAFSAGINIGVPF